MTASAPSSACTPSPNARSPSWSAESLTSEAVVPGLTAITCSSGWIPFGAFSHPLSKYGAYAHHGGWLIVASIVLSVNVRMPFAASGSPAVVEWITARPLERPVSVGSQGAAVAVGQLKVWRDTYYTTSRTPSDPDVKFQPEDPSTWPVFETAPVSTFYVQPGHYLCLGDNSPESSDGRSWGLVPERLLLGRALFVYYPFYFPYWPFSSPVNRVGPIR